MSPPSRIARVTGLLTPSASEEDGFLLELQADRRLRVLWRGGAIDAIEPLLGKRVLLEGRLEFRPDGQPRALLADRAREAMDRDERWREIPRSTSTPQPRARLLEPGEPNPLDKLHGILDGHVTEEAFATIVETFRPA